MKSFDELLEKAVSMESKTLVVAAAEDEVVIKAVADAVEKKIIKAILVGNEEKICNICLENSVNLQELSITVINEEDVNLSAQKAVDLIVEGKADYIMKGHISTAKVLKEVLRKDANLKKEKILSHVMVYSVPNYDKLLLISDGGMVTYPGLEEKISIINNAVALSKALEIKLPKVAVLSAVEVVNDKMECTVQASALKLMNSRGQIKDCIIDGPLALDNAISKEAAKHKGIVSKVAGEADILIVPNIESGNILGKSLTYFAQAKNAGVIMGAKCPVVLVSRADSRESKLYSIALGAILS